ncbi:MAG: hypothetical protein Gaeavirus4_24 [Gaeavirus sp.]|uniref:MORN repeat-containing protein n=1 Tax=Gaeavirus sp. TaxID=2487767 RepID=A0A3G5A1E0_9VIRU|nr:MAG: hypothetical protein Gaeavirus4_24 [Gaeavirus sp.]
MTETNLSPLATIKYNKQSIMTETNLSPLETIKVTYKDYLNDDYIFKSVCGYIVIMKRIHDSPNNEDRTDVIDRQYAKFRTKDALPVFIINKYSPHDTLTTIDNTYYQYPMSSAVTYTVDKVTTIENYNTDIEKVCAPGIHYYNSIETAFYHDIYASYPICNGNYKDWDTNGGEHIITKTIDGQIYTDQTIRYQDGSTYKSSYKNGIRHGKEINHNSNNQITLEGQYIDGKKEGVWIFNNIDTGIPTIRDFYINDILKYEIMYHIDGIKIKKLSTHHNNIKTTISYTELGQIKSIKKYNIVNTLMSFKKYKFDELHRKISKTIYNDAKPQVDKVRFKRYTYNVDGITTEIRKDDGEWHVKKVNTTTIAFSTPSHNELPSNYHPIKFNTYLSSLQKHFKIELSSTPIKHSTNTFDLQNYLPMATKFVMKFIK